MRPKRLYVKERVDKEPSYFYLVGGRKRKIKLDKKMSQKQIQKVNIINVIGELKGKRIKKKGKAKRVLYSKKVIPEQEPMRKSGIDAFYTPSKVLPSLADVQSRIEKTKDTDAEKLAAQIFELVKGKKPPIPQIPKPTIVGLPMGIPMGEVIEPITPIKPGREEAVSAPTPKTPATPLKPTDRDFAKKLMLEYYLNKKSMPQTETVNKLLRLKFHMPIDAKLRKEIADEIFREQSGKGALSSDDGLYNDQIEQSLKEKTNMYVPVIASDEIDTLKKYIKPNMKKFAFVINTVPSSSDGSGKDGYPAGHWRACFIDNRDDYPSIEFFDPLADKPEKAITNFLKEVAHIINPERLFLYKQNMVKRQNNTSANCGQFCIKFIEDRNRGVSFSEASGFDDYLKQQGGVLDNSVDGEKEIEQFKRYL